MSGPALKELAMTPIDRQLTPPGGWQSPGRVRLAPLTREEAGPVRGAMIWAIGRLGKLDASNLFQTMMRNFRLYLPWQIFASRMMPFGELERRDTELAILRVAWLSRSRYEWGQHVDIGLRAGVEPAEIVRVTRGPTAPGWAPKQVAILRACDELHAVRMVSDATWSELAAVFDDRLLLELIMLINHYIMLAGVLNSLGLELDVSVERALAAAPIHLTHPAGSVLPSSSMACDLPRSTNGA